MNRDIFTPDPVIPHGVISTLGGTGSEQSLCAMVVDDSLEVPEKVGLYNLASSLISQSSIQNLPIPCRRR